MGEDNETGIKDLKAKGKITLILEDLLDKLKELYSLFQIVFDYFDAKSQNNESKADPLFPTFAEPHEG